MATVGSIVVNIVANIAPLNKGLNAARTALRGFGGAGMAMAGGMLFGQMASDFEKFNQAVQRATAPIDTTKRQLSEMRAEFIELARTSVYSAVEIADSFKMFIQAGMDAKQAMAALPISMAFGQAGHIESIEKATDMLLKSQGALRMRDDDPTKNAANLKRISDLLTQAQIQTTASLEEMGEALQNKAGGAIRAYNLELEESIALLALFHEQGVTGEKAGTAFNIVVRDWTTQFVKHNDAFMAMGVHVYDTAGKMRPLTVILHELEAAMAGLSDEQRKATMLAMGFTDRSVAFTNAIMGTSGALLKFREGLKGVNGITKEISDKTITEFQQAWSDLRASIRLFSETAMLPLMWVLGGLMMVVSKTVNFLGQLGKVFRETQDEESRLTAKILVGVGAFISTIWVVTNVIKIVKMLIGALRLLTITEAIRQALSGPKGWAILAVGIAAAGAAVVGLNAYYAEMDASAAKASKSTQKLGMEVGDMKEEFKDFMDEMGITASGGPTKLASVVTDLDNLTERAKQITSDVRTPFEVLIDLVAELDKLLSLGLITAETYNRALLKGQADYARDMESEKDDDKSESTDAYKAFIKGTTEEWSARFGTGRNMIKIEEEALAEAKAAKALLAKIHATLSKTPLIGAWSAP